MSTHTQRSATTVQRSIVVEAPLDQAFKIFAEQFDRVKPREHNLLQAEIAESVFEPRVGGSVYDRGVDGSECRWARVLAYEPPRRFVISWDVNLQWQLETDRDKASEVDVRFTAIGPDRTRVELEHRNIERHGPGWEQMRDAVGSPGGWPAGMNAFAERVES